MPIVPGGEIVSQSVEKCSSTNFYVKDLRFLKAESSANERCWQKNVHIYKTLASLQITKQDQVVTGYTETISYKHYRDPPLEPLSLIWLHTGGTACSWGFDCPQLYRCVIFCTTYRIIIETFSSCSHTNITIVTIAWIYRTRNIGKCTRRSRWLILEHATCLQSENH